MKIFENPGVLPRAWTVHALRAAADETRAVAMILDGTLDPGREAIVAGPQPRLEVCAQPDRIQQMRFDLQSLRVDVEMGCGGLLLISDNWYPGWTASADGKTTPILKVDTTLRGVLLEKGKHTVTMRYRPLTVIAGFFLFLAGIGITAWAVRRREQPGLNLLAVQN
jgi:hypothetical protein